MAYATPCHADLMSCKSPKPCQLLPVPACHMAPYDIRVLLQVPYLYRCNSRYKPGAARPSNHLQKKVLIRKTLEQEIQAATTRQRAQYPRTDATSCAGRTSIVIIPALRWPSVGVLLVCHGLLTVGLAIGWFLLGRAVRAPVRTRTAITLRRRAAIALRRGAGVATAIIVRWRWFLRIAWRRARGRVLFTGQCYRRQRRGSEETRREGAAPRSGRTYFCDMARIRARPVKDTGCLLRNAAAYAGKASGSQGPTERGRQDGFPFCGLRTSPFRRCSNGMGRARKEVVTRAQRD